MSQKTQALLDKKETNNETKNETKEEGTSPATVAAEAVRQWSENSWIQLSQWMSVFKVFIVIGVTIFTIGQFSGVSDTDLAAYIWFALALIITWVLSLRLVAQETNSEVGFWSAMTSASAMLPALGTLLPLGVLIYVLITVRPILQNNLNNLPKQFFWFNRLTFFLVVMQMFILSKFYNTVDDQDDSYRSIWIASMILFSVLTSAAAIELYVIITAFITDG
jgi:hypothetical protein